MDRLKTYINRGGGGGRGRKEGSSDGGRFRWLGLVTGWFRELVHGRRT